jgi:hypothetical protein
MNKQISKILVAIGIEIIHAASTYLKENRKEKDGHSTEGTKSKGAGD